MKIVIPLSCADDYPIFAQAGADEFFIGYVPLVWLERYINIIPINRREYILGTYSIHDAVSMNVIQSYIQKNNLPVAITLNAHYFVKSQYPILMDIIAELINMNFDTFILADLGLIIYLKEKGINCKIQISSEMEVCNSRTIRFLKDLNVQRIIFSRKTSLDEMKQIIDNVDDISMEYEAFCLNDLCPYSGAFCNSIHGDCLNPVCSVPVRGMRYSQQGNKFKREYKYYEKMTELTINNKQPISTYKLGASGCGVCRIKTMADNGVTHLKVVGRGAPKETMCADISNIKKVIALSENSDIKDYDQMIKDKFFPDGCTFLCYYT